MQEVLKYSAATKFRNPINLNVKFAVKTRCPANYFTRYIDVVLSSATPPN